jgi:hypothetical protein
MPALCRALAKACLSGGTAKGEMSFPAAPTASGTPAPIPQGGRKAYKKAIFNAASKASEAAAFLAALQGV